MQSTFDALPSLILVQTCRDMAIYNYSYGDHDHDDGTIRARSIDIMHIR